MEPVLILLAFGVFGGGALALLILLFARANRSTTRTFVPRHLAAPSPALINMAHIRVEGVGGMGLVLAVLAVAVSDPRIRVAMILASLLGAGLAIGLIAFRRREGAVPFGGHGPDTTRPLGLVHDNAAALPTRAPSNPLRVHLFDAFQRRQFLDGLPALLFGQSDFVEALKIQPELWARSQKVSQAQRRVKHYATCRE
jgi:hypothetical protein